MYGSKSPDVAVLVATAAKANTHSVVDRLSMRSSGDIVVLAFEIPDFDDIPDLEEGKDGRDEWELVRVAGNDYYAVYTYANRVVNLRMSED